jgi:hypothetical protein
MKMCPWNREDTVEARALIDLSISNPGARKSIIETDDAAGGGGRNLIKRWWFDLEVVNGVAGKPVAGTNERDLNLGRDEKLMAMQRIAIFPPELQPTGGTTVGQVVPADRAAGMDALARAESPASARTRIGCRGD